MFNETNNVMLMYLCGQCTDRNLPPLLETKKEELKGQEEMKNNLMINELVDAVFDQYHQNHQNDKPVDTKTQLIE